MDMLGTAVRYGFIALIGALILTILPHTVGIYVGKIDTPSAYAAETPQMLRGAQDKLEEWNTDPNIREKAYKGLPAEVANARDLGLFCGENRPLGNHALCRMQRENLVWQMFDQLEYAAKYAGSNQTEAKRLWRKWRERFGFALFVRPTKLQSGVYRWVRQCTGGISPTDKPLCDPFVDDPTRKALLEETIALLAKSNPPGPDVARELRAVLLVSLLRGARFYT